jgi:hypothetical protein
MERELVESANIQSIGYDPSTQILEVEFKKNGKIYQYEDVEEATYQELMDSPSLGKALHSLITSNSNHPCTQL